MIVTFFNDYAATSKREAAMPIDELAALVKVTSAPAKAALPWLKLAKFGDTRSPNGSLRHNTNIVALTGVAVDYDGELMSIDEAVERLDKAGVTALVYTSPSHHDDAPRWRALCPSSVELPPAEHDRMVARLNGLLGGVLAPESWTLSQAYFYGRVGDNPAHRVEVVDGMTTLDRADELDECAIGKPNGHSADHIASEPQAQIGDIVAALTVIPNVERDWMKWNRIGMATWSASGGCDEGLAAFIEWSRKSDVFDTEETNFRWRHFRDSPPDQIGFGTLAHLAKEADPGWVSPSRRRAAERGIDILPYHEMLQPNLATKSRIKGVVDDETLVLIVGETGCGKTFLGLDLALHVAAGRNWIGRKVRQGRVVYIASEAGRSIGNRVAAWAAKHTDGTGIDFRAVLSPVDLCHMADKANLDHLAQLVAEIGKADLLVVDTVSRALAGGDENSAADMGNFVVAVDRLRAQLGCIVIAIHHIGKDASRGARGHSLLRCAVDTEIAVERRDGGVSVATVTKQRDGMAGAEIAFRLRQVELGADQDGDPVTSCVVEAADYVPAARAKGPTGQAKAALDVLWAVISEKGEPVPGGDLLLRGVTVDDWKTAMERTGRFGDMKSGQFRTAWSRARNLAEEGHIAFGDGYVWLCDGAAGEIPF